LLEEATAEDSDYESDFDDMIEQRPGAAEEQLLARKRLLKYLKVQD